MDHSLSHLSALLPSDFHMEIPYAFRICPVLLHASPLQYPRFHHATDTVKPAYKGTGRDLIFSTAERFRFIPVFELCIPRTGTRTGFHYDQAQFKTRFRHVQVPFKTCIRYSQVELNI